jgi:ATP-binding cassette, subfamily B, bacterial
VSEHTGVPTEDAARLFWSLAALRDAEENLILRSGLPLTAQSLPAQPTGGGRFMEDNGSQWVRRAPHAVGLDVIEEVDVPLNTLLRRFLSITGPILVVFQPGGGGEVVLTAILEPGAWGRVLKPDGTEARMPRAAIHAAIAQLAASESQSLSAIFDSLPGGRAALQKLRKSDALGGLGHLFLARFTLDGAHPIASQISVADGWKALGASVAISAVQALAALGAFWALGNTMVDGQIDMDRIVGWSLLAASDAPLQYLGSRALANFSISLGSAIKRRSLEGTFFAEEKEVRAKGFGELIARTSEASVVEQLSLGEASGIFAAVFEIIGSAVFLARGEPNLPSLLALGACLLAAAVVVRRSIRDYREVYIRRMSLTDDLVDKIIGHRTRAVQQSPRQRHSTEDFDLSEYTRVAQRLDRTRAITTVMPRVWLTIGAGILLGAFVARAPLSALVYSALGILLCYRALVSFFPAVERLVEWYTAWRGIESLIIAGKQRGLASRPLDRDVDEDKFATTLSVSAATFAYRAGGRPILADANLRVRRGEKVLLEGASGSGKTTLFKLIAGEGAATSGIILVGGSDRFSVSDVEWRRRVASAPQFHENYVFSNTLSFNLNPWGEPGVESPEAREICEELGLRPLLERMPQGFAQVVGETGWQLSHGEQSRVFIARALLQRADLVLFDESFGALDPETLMKALECVRRRAKTLIVIAHT